MTDSLKGLRPIKILMNAEAKLVYTHFHVISGRSQVTGPYDLQMTWGEGEMKREECSYHPHFKATVPTAENGVAA